MPLAHLVQVNKLVQVLTLERIGLEREVLVRTSAIFRNSR